MARKSSKSSRKEKKLAINRDELLKVLDSRRNNNNRKSANNFSASNKTKLEGEFGPLLDKFKLLARDEITHGNGEGTVDIRPNSSNELERELDSNEETMEKHNSRRKLRKLEQPTLSQLKSETLYPEMIEWYDCNASYPHLLVSIKSSKNIVPVPGHWQMKREYLSGRSLLEKRPFELPYIIRQTNIEKMRRTLPNGEEDAPEESSKQISRARVQPKLGTLDVDYKKLYEVFFKLGANWKPDLLLQFGDLYYENRNLYDESQWKRFSKEKMPGRLSQELRDAINLKEGQLPPWCLKMKSLGLPPGYPKLKIAGLNWGIENIKGDAYGKLDVTHGRDKQSLFGALLSVGEDTDEDETMEVGWKQEQVQESLTSKMETATSHISNVVDTPKQDHISPPQSLEENESGEDAPKRLYTILSEG